MEGLDPATALFVLRFVNQLALIAVLVHDTGR
jgi:hypothetical protein